jgi:2-dehydro-3-deoxyglucarate aldolase
MTKIPQTRSANETFNPFRRDLQGRRQLIGCWASLGSAITTEVLGVAGFDWLLLDCEHAPNDVLSLVPQLMALKDSVSAAVVRPPSNDPITIKRMLDIGCHNFLIPMVDSANQARAAVAATRYPPQGIRGVSVSQRSNRYGAVANYFHQINDQIAVVVQIESCAGVAAASEIAAVNGVDALFVGPSDLAAAYGRLGNPNHPDVQAAIAEVQAAGIAAGKTIGILAPAEADARRYLKQGFNLVAVGSDLGVLRMHSQALCDRYREAVNEPIAAQY